MGLDLKSKHIRAKKSKSFSLLIVPQSSDVKQFNVSSWIPKLLIFLIIITISSSSFFILDLYASYNSLEFDYFAKSRKLDLVTSVNSNQKEEIHNLEARLTEFDEKLRTITELEQTVIRLVGLDQNTKKNDSSTDVGNNIQMSALGSDDIQANAFVATRGDTSLLRKDPLLMGSLDNRDFQIDVISQMLEESQKNLSTLIDDVEKRLDYLEAKPNLTPASGHITSPFGYRNNPFGRGREFHSGVDIANNYGIKIKAAGGGIVTCAGYNGGYGYVIVIKHGYGYETIYGHNQKLLVKVGDHVTKGQVISQMGSSGRSTGPHVHFEVRYQGTAIDPYTVLNNDD